MGRSERSEQRVGRELRPRGPVRFGVTVDTVRDDAVAAVTGELDIFTAPRLGSAIDAFVRRGHGTLVVDLGGLEFVDSTGLHILLRTHRRLARGGRRLIIRCEGPVRHVIELARLDALLELEPSPPDP